MRFPACEPKGPPLVRSRALSSASGGLPGGLGWTPEACGEAVSAPLVRDFRGLSAGFRLRPGAPSHARVSGPVELLLVAGDGSARKSTMARRSFMRFGSSSSTSATHLEMAWISATSALRRFRALPVLMVWALR